MLPILFDEMYEGQEEKLIKHGYEAYSVRKLREQKNLKLQYDYSIIKYVEQNKMILITEEIDNKNGCDENDIPCIRLGQNPSAEEMIQQLEKYKDLSKTNNDELNESNIGLKIKSKLGFNIVKHLKLVRSSSSLIRSIAFLSFARKDIKNKNFLQCGSNLYYSAFHLASSFIFLANEPQLKLDNYLLGPKTSNDTKKKRILNISHTELPKYLLKVSGHDDFKENLSKSLKELVELRELNSYGPYLQLLKDYDESEKDIGFLYTFVLQKEHFNIGSKQKTDDKRLFTETYRMCEMEYEKIGNLINDYFKIFVEQKSRFGKYQSGMLAYVIPALIPNILSPLSDKSTLKEIEKKMENLAKLLGNEEKKMFNQGKKRTAEPQRKTVEKGEVLTRIRLGLSKKYIIGSG